MDMKTMLEEWKAEDEAMHVDCAIVRGQATRVDWDKVRAAHTEYVAEAPKRFLDSFKDMCRETVEEFAMYSDELIHRMKHHA